MDNFWIGIGLMTAIQQVLGFQTIIPAFSKSVSSSKAFGGGSCIRMAVNAAELLSIIGSQVRLTVKAPPSASIAFSDIYFGHAAASGDAYDFDGNQRTALFGGVNSLSLSGGGDVVSDWLDFNFDGGKGIVFSYYSAGGGTEACLTGQGANYGYYFKLGNDTSATNTSGFSVQSGTLGTLSKIEVR